MGTGYTRNDTSNNIADGNIINASDLDGEFNAIESAMGTSGHTHDGTSAEGGPVTVIGPGQDFIASGTALTAKGTGYDLGSTGTEFEDLFLTGKAYIDGFGESTLFDTTSKIQFRDSALFINSSADGQLDLEADTTIELTAPTVALTNDLSLQSDGAILTFGEHDEVTVTHVHNTGLNSKSANGFVLGLQTFHTSIVENDVLGKIEFSSPNQTGGGDGVLVGASIEAVAEATFSTTVNSSALVFKTNTGDAATERMRLTSAGDLHFLDNRKAIFGAESDLQIYHNPTGSHSYITESGGGSLYIQGTELNLTNAAGNSTYANFVDGGAAFIRHAGSTKLATTSTGIDVTGTVTADGLTVDNGSSGQSKITISEGGAGNRNLVLYSPATGSTNSKIAVEGTTANLDFVVNNGAQTAIRIGGSTGDISFYESDGSTASFVYDASTSTTFNDASLDRDFIVKTDNSSATFYVDGQYDGVGIHTTTPVSFANAQAVLFIEDNTNPAICLSDTGQANDYYFVASGNRMKIVYGVGSNTGSTVSQVDLLSTYNDSTGVVINEGGANRDFRVESDTDQYALFVDGETGGIQMGGSSDFTGSIDADSDGRLGLVNTGNGHAGLNFFRSDTSISAGNVLGKISAYNNDTADNDVVELVRIQMAADGAFGNTDNPTKLEFYTTPDASETIRQVGYFNNTGKLFTNFGAEINTSQNNSNGDFKVSSSSNSHMLFVDSGDNVIGMGLSNPNSYYSPNLVLAVGDNGGITIRNTASTTGTNYLMFADGDSGADRYRGMVQYTHNDDRMVFSTNATGRLELSAVESVFNNSGADTDFRVESDAKQKMLFVDGGENVVAVGMLDSYTTPSWIGNGSFVMADNFYQFQGAGTDQGVWNQSVDTNQSYHMHNAYYSGGWKQHVADVSATMYQSGSGLHRFQVANANSSADQAISWRPLLNMNEAAGFDWNPSSYSNADFRVRSDGNSNMLTVDAGNNIVSFSKLGGGSTSYGGYFSASGSGFFHQVLTNTTSDSTQANLFINRQGSEGQHIQLRVGDVTKGLIGAETDSNSQSMYIGFGDTGLAFQNKTDNAITPMDTNTGVARDNLIDLGASGARFDDIYATNGTIQTSDRNEKQDIAELSEAEQRVAVAAKSLMRKYRWKDSVAEKGDSARTHFGIIAQDLQAAFEAEGLDAHDYAMFTSNTEWKKEIEKPVVVGQDNDGNTITEMQMVMVGYNEPTEGATEHTRLGVRYPELFAFIISAI